jgi:hypothetical protein
MIQLPAANMRAGEVPNIPTVPTKGNDLGDIFQDMRHGDSDMIIELCVFCVELKAKSHAATSTGWNAVSQCWPMT